MVLPHVDGPDLAGRLRRILADAGVTAIAPIDLETALTHASFSIESGAGDAARDQERLEFLGDAALGLCVALMLYEHSPDLAPGDMTRLRAELVSGDALAEVAAAWRFGEALRLGRGEAANGGRTRGSNLSRAMEAVIGAVYLAAGLAGAMAVAQAAVGGRLRQLAGDPQLRDPKSALQEWAQARGDAPVYRVVARAGPDHAPQWTVTVALGAAECAATAGTRRQAEKEAARSLLARLVPPTGSGEVLL